MSKLSLKSLRSQTEDFIKDNCEQERRKAVCCDCGKKDYNYTLTKLKPDADVRKYFKLYRRWGKLLRKHLDTRKADAIREEIVKLVTILKD